MANNANINKVIYGNDTLIDLTGDTVTQADVLNSKSFHDASGTLRTGTGDISGKADLTDLAPVFSTSINYTSGQYVTYDGDMYRFIATHSAGAWNSNHVEKITVARDLIGKQNNLSFDTTDFSVFPMASVDYDLNPYSVALNKSTSVTWADDQVVTSGAVYSALATKADVSKVIPYFSLSTSYKKGDYVSSNGSSIDGVYRFYRFTADHPAGAWSGFDVEEITIKDALADKIAWTDNTRLGAKNLLPFPFSQGSLTQNGVTFTVNADGTVSTSGTCNNSNGSSLFLWQNEIPTWMDSNVDYVLTGCPSGGSTSTYMVQYSNWTEGTSQIYYDEGSGVDIRKITDSTTQRLRIWIKNGVNANGLVFKPMIRLKSDTDDTYAKYSKTNVALTRDKVEWSANLLTGVHNIDASQYFEGTSNDVTWSYIDGVFDAHGTATANSQKGTPFTAPYSAQVIVSGCNSGNANIHIYPFDITDNNRPYRDSTKNSRLTTSDNVYNGNEISFYMEQGHQYQITCRVVNGNTANHVKFYPLLRLASDPDTTYTPYAMTNAELTKKTIFVATYGSTTYAEINKAFNDGKYIVVKREIADTSYFTYYLKWRDTSGTYYFQTFGNSNTTNYYCYINSSTWAVGSVYLAPLASPALTGTPTAPTATAGTNTTQIATTAFVQTAIDNAVTSALSASY